jgi:hypothetical protein
MLTFQHHLKGLSGKAGTGFTGGLAPGFHLRVDLFGSHGIELREEHEFDLLTFICLQKLYNNGTARSTFASQSE